jgi:hypothetical protein
MTTNVYVADHKSAIVDLAKTVGMQRVYDEGASVILGDFTYADHYLHGNLAAKHVGVSVEISFNERGEVQRAHKLVDGVTKGDVTGTVGNAGQRLLWTLHLFSRR